MSRDQPQIHIGLPTPSGDTRPGKAPLTPEDIAQRQSAKAGVKVSYGLAWAAGLFAAVALVFNVRLAIELASSWDDGIGFVVIAIAITVGLTFIPVGVALLESGYPRDSARLLVFWYVLLTCSAVAATFTVIQTDTAKKLSVEEAQRVADLHHKIRVITPAELAVWNRTGNCEAPDRSGDGEVCDRMASRDAAARAEIAEIQGGKVAALMRRIGQLVVSLLAIIGAGLLTKASVLSTAESHRLATGETGFKPAQPAPSPAAPLVLSEGGQIYDAEAQFHSWRRDRLLEVPGGSVGGDEAHQDYADTCRAHGIEPWNSNQFGNKLTALQKASEGKIRKGKHGGRMTYFGWQLPAKVEMLEYASPKRLTGPS